MKINRLSPNPAILEELGRRLTQIRKQRRLSQDALAEEAGIGVATLRRLEDGRDGRLGSWLRILKALDMAPAIDAFLPEDLRSPMADAQQDRRKNGPKQDLGTDIVWGDER